MKLKNSAIVQAFTGTKVVPSPWLNRVGLQVARTASARLLYNVRPTPISDELKPMLKEIQDHGMLMIENFFDDQTFEQLREECMSVFHAFPERITHKQMGPTHYSIAALKEYKDIPMPNIDKFFADARLIGLMQGAEKRTINMAKVHRAIERVQQGSETTEGDPETAMHSDAFYHTHKAWLYLTDVTPKDAPLAFVPGTHKLRRPTWKYVYSHSCDPKQPSRRITQTELDELGVREKVLACKKNTLVLANVCGYHRRSVGQPGGERFALLCSVRSQPFAYWAND